MPRVRKLPKRSSVIRRAGALGARPTRVRPKTKRSNVPGIAKAPPKRRKVTASTRRERRLRKEGQPFLRAAQNRFGRSQRRKYKYKLAPGESEGSGWRRYSKTRARARAQGVAARPGTRPPAATSGPGGVVQPGGPGQIASDISPTLPPGGFPAPPPVSVGKTPMPDPYGPKAPMPTDPWGFQSGPYVPHPLPTGINENLSLDDPMMSELLRAYLRKMMEQAAQGGMGGPSTGGMGGPIGV